MGQCTLIFPTTRNEALSEVFVQAHVRSGASPDNAKKACAEKAHIAHYLKIQKSGASPTVTSGVNFFLNPTVVSATGEESEFHTARTPKKGAIGEIKVGNSSTGETYIFQLKPPCTQCTTGAPLF